MKNLTHTYFTITHLHHFPNLVWSQQLLQQHCQLWWLKCLAELQDPSCHKPGLEDRNWAPEPLQVVMFVDEGRTQVSTVMGHMDITI